jgi:hypothetical protein
MDVNELNEPAIEEVPTVTIIADDDTGVVIASEDGVVEVVEAPTVDLSGFGPVGAVLFTQATMLSALLDEAMATESNRFTTKKAVAVAYVSIREKVGVISKALYALRPVCLAEKASKLETVDANAGVRQLESIEKQIAALEAKRDAAIAADAAALTEPVAA